MDALYLVSPHGSLIASGKKTAIVQADLAKDLRGDWMLVSGTGVGNAPGHILTGEPVAVTVEQFGSLFMDHRVTVRERERWWPDADTLHLYPIEYFKAYDEPRSVVVPPGVQVVMRDVVLRDSVVQDVSIEEKVKEVDMPWKVFKKGDEFCVYTVGGDNKPIGKPKGCHKTAKEARAQQSFLYAAQERGEIKADDGLASLGDAMVKAMAQSLATKQDDDAGEGEEVGVVSEVVAEEPESGPELEPELVEEEPVVEEAVVEEAPVEERKSTLQSLRDAFDNVLAELGNVFKREKAVTQFAQPYLCKARDGRTWLVTWTTNAFIDRDGEIFTTDAIKEYVDRHRNEKVKGQFWYKHIEGTKFADILCQGVAGRFLVEAGPFDDTLVGRAFKQLFEQYPNGHPVYSPEGWGCSHGYKYREDDRRDRVYEWFEKRETSPLPARIASNPHNPKVEVIQMDKKDQAMFVDALGDDVAKRIVQLGNAITEQKETDGVEHKEVKEQVGSAETIDADGIKQIVEALHLDALSDAIKAQSDAITTLTTEVSEMKKRLGEVERTDEERLAEKEQSLPRFSWMRPSQSEATEVKKDDLIKSAMPSKAPAPVQALVNRQSV